MTYWICANCGAKHESKSSPCRECAGENFAKLEEKDIPDRIESSLELRWECTECGSLQQTNDTACNNCGNHLFDAVQITRGATDEADSEEGAKVDSTDSPETQRDVTAGVMAVYLVGIGTSLTGFLYVLDSVVLFGIGLIVTGVFILPVTRRRSINQYGYQLSTGALLVAYVIGLFVSLTLYNL